MLKTIRSFFEQKIQPAGRQGQAPQRALQLATAALLIEVARADYHVDAKERHAIVAAVAQMFSLSREETDEIVALAEAEMEDATCLFEFTRLINSHFDYAQKLKIIEMMWSISFADLDKDKYEEHLIRKISELIYVSHHDFVRLRHQLGG